MKLEELIPDFDMSATTVYLSGCTGLTEVPAFPKATYVDLSGCTGLTEVPAFPKATYVYLIGCRGLTEVPAFPNATTVSLSGCTGLTEVPAFPNATTVYLSGCTGLTEVPAFPKATTVHLSGCTGLARILGRPVNSAEQARPYLEQIAANALPNHLKMDSVHCGTSHCIAGWAGVLFPEDVRREWELVDAITLLGNEAHAVFYEDHDAGREFLEQFLPNKETTPC